MLVKTGLKVLSFNNILLMTTAEKCKQRLSNFAEWRCHFLPASSKKENLCCVWFYFFILVLQASRNLVSCHDCRINSQVADSTSKRNGSEQATLRRKNYFPHSRNLQVIHTHNERSPRGTQHTTFLLMITEINYGANKETGFFFFFFLPAV